MAQETQVAAPDQSRSTAPPHGNGMAVARLDVAGTERDALPRCHPPVRLAAKVGIPMRYATRVEGLGGAEAAAWDIHNEAVARRARGEDVILLSIGDPDFPTSAPIVAAAKSSLDRGRTHYAAVVGQPELRSAIAAEPPAPVGAAMRPVAGRRPRRRPVRAVHGLPMPVGAGRHRSGPGTHVRHLSRDHRGGRRADRPGAADRRARLPPRPRCLGGGGDPGDAGDPAQLAPQSRPVR